MKRNQIQYAKDRVSTVPKCIDMIMHHKQEKVENIHSISKEQEYLRLTTITIIY